MTRVRRVLGWLTLALAAVPLVAQQPPPGRERPEGDLQRFINPDTTDLLTKLEVLRHTLYSVQQQLTLVSFRQLYGDRVRLEKVWYPNVDHDLTPGYVFEPVERQAGHRYPGLVMVHGGYHWSFSENDFTLVVLAVEEGYVVVFPEYRGSKGYGAEHYRALDYGGKEVDDVLWAADYLARRPYVDESRVGILGRSKGGFLTLHAIARQPKKFRAAVDVVGLVDFLAYMSYKPDYRRNDVARQPSFGGKLPFDNLPAYLEASPLTHVDRIETPLLVLSTTHDRTVPLELHTRRLIDALEAGGKTYEYHLYERAPGGHAYAAGDSEEARDTRERIFRFLNKYLQP